MAPLRQAWPIHRTAEVHATSRRSAPTLSFLCSLSAIAQGKSRSHGGKEPGQRSAVKAASRRSRSRAARALTAHRWSGSGPPCDHGRTSCRRARATRRYTANDGARNVDFEQFFGLSGTRSLHAVPLQCHPKQCADKHLQPPAARSGEPLLSCRRNCAWSHSSRTRLATASSAA